MSFINFQVKKTGEKITVWITTDLQENTATERINMDKITVYIYALSGTHRPEATEPSPETSPSLPL